MKFFVAEPRLRRLASSNNRKHFASVDGLAFFGENALEGAALGRADFVLHLHGFDNQKALSGFDVVSCFHEETHDFTRHGRHDLLTAFGFGVAVAAAAPGARIDDFGGKFPRAGLEFQFAVRRRRHADFEGLAFKQNGDNVGSNLDGIDCDGPAIQGDSPASSFAFEFDDAFFFAGGGSELDFVSHGRRSSCSRRPSCFQREGWAAGAAEGEECLSDWFACQIAAAMAAASGTELTGCFSSAGGAAERGRRSKSSSHLVWMSPRRKSGSVRMRRKRPTLVLMPVIVYSSRARRRRAMVSSRLLPQAMSLLRSGS